MPRGKGRMKSAGKSVLHDTTAKINPLDKKIDQNDTADHGVESIPCGWEPMSYVYSVLCIRLFFCRGIRSMAIRSLHLLVRARTGGQMLIAEITSRFGVCID